MQAPFLWDDRTRVWLEESDGTNHTLRDVDYMVKKPVGAFRLGDSEMFRFATVSFGYQHATSGDQVFFFVVRVECVPMAFTGVSVSPN
jgi:hypothetical protein